MEYILNGRKIDTVKDGWFNKKVLYCYRDFFNRLDFNRELRKISANNILRPDCKGRGKYVLINGIGLAEWICKSCCFSSYEKYKYVDELKSKGLISHDFIIGVYREESDFIYSLECFLKSFDFNIAFEKQRIIEPYYVDAIINNRLIIEFDENNHETYDHNIEIKREADLLSKGYSIIRISDKDNIGKSLGIICDWIVNNKTGIYKSY